MLLLDDPPAINDRNLAHWLDEARDLLRSVARHFRLQDAVKAKRLLEAQARRLLGGVVAQVEPVLVSITEAIRNAKLKLGGWWQTFRNAIVPGHFAGAMALLNNPDPAPVDLAAIVDQANRQVAFLAGFRQQLASGQQLLSGAPARASLYARAVWATAMNVQRGRMRRDGWKFERRVLGIADHCNGCLSESMQGWQPIGTLAAIGDTECRSRCACHFQYR